MVPEQVCFPTSGEKPRRELPIGLWVDRAPLTKFKCAIAHRPPLQRVVPMFPSGHIRQVAFGMVSVVGTPSDRVEWLTVIEPHNSL